MTHILTQTQTQNLTPTQIHQGTITLTLAHEHHASKRDLTVQLLRRSLQYKVGT